MLACVCQRAWPDVIIVYLWQTHLLKGLTGCPTYL